VGEVTLCAAGDMSRNGKIVTGPPAILPFRTTPPGRHRPPRRMKPLDSRNAALHPWLVVLGLALGIIPALVFRQLVYNNYKK